MDIITKENIKQLFGVKKSNCLSLYMPIVKTGREVRENEIRLKNLLKRSRELLEEKGFR
ncbi:MAG: hypothetical protein GF375_07620, partial [Candidatus Omnitrophica bacterium]|nr:hypothetical protein [Candidatus Omnitrophota bacterium]